MLARLSPLAKKLLSRTLKFLLCLYVLECTLLFFFQEKLLFFPEKLSPGFRYTFATPFEELNIQTKDGTVLNGLLFKAGKPRGLIFYLHGNAGSLKTWGEAASCYTDLQFDVFFLDYRGYGKSGGAITSRQQFFDDVQAAYDVLKKKYAEEKIVVLGYSIGTGPAAHLAANNHPKCLILQAPYYSVADMMRQRFPLIPTFLLKYNFETNNYLQQCRMPAILFHGTLDGVIDYDASLRLKKFFKPTDTLVTLAGQGHNGMTDNPQYRASLEQLLNTAFAKDGRQ